MIRLDQDLNQGILPGSVDIYLELKGRRDVHVSAYNNDHLQSHYLIHSIAVCIFHAQHTRNTVREYISQGNRSTFSV